MAAIDYESLRQQTMTTGEDAAVTVNTRALIDKVLARYSSEYTTLRELIQNAADAGATKVSIKFETSPSLEVPAPQSLESHVRLQHTIKHHAISNLIVTNNGQPFMPADWARLKSIAEGNPDETKIGAFGVGFYSVFADCDEPFVISGENTMAFFWKGNTLYTRSGRLPSDQNSSLTTFSLPYRNLPTSSGAASTSPVPNLLTLCQFLSTSLTFVGLEQIDLVLDEWNISTFRKMSSPANDLPLPADFKPNTERNIMVLRNISSQTAQIDATWSNVVGWIRDPKKEAIVKVKDDIVATGSILKGFLSRLTIGSESSKTSQKKSIQPDESQKEAPVKETTSGTSSATVFVRVHTLHVQTKVTAAFSRELERATKKPPPKTTRVSVLTSPFDESSASLISQDGQTSNLASKIFSSVLPTTSGRIFIGFPTAQTTGPLCHISMPSIIPTVERESIDLNAKHISTWNSELLQVAGIGCRLAFLAEMKNLQNRTTRMLDSKEALPLVVAKSIPEANHIFKQFTFQGSTPSSKVGDIIERGFWNCTTRQGSGSASSSMLLLSTQGVLPSYKVRITAEKLSFLNRFPVIPEAILESSSEFLAKVLSNGLLSQMTVDDIRQELEARALTEDELIEFLKWCGTKVSEQQFTTAEVQALFKSTIADTSASKGHTNGTGILQLSSVKTFLNAGRISPEMPLPPTNVPFIASQSIPMAQLRSFGWEELQIVPWLEYVVQLSMSAREVPEDCNMTKSSEFASKVLITISKAWEQLNPASKSKVADLLGQHETMPTSQGMRKPGESYMPSVKGFSNLAIITTVGLKPKFTTAIGVRTTVELSVAFKDLESTLTTKGRKPAPEGWDHEQILKYFGSVLSEIPKSDIDRLKTIPFCLAEKDRNNYLWKVSELYAPSEGIQRVRLPTIRLKAYRPDSPEGKLLKELGLVPCPTISTLIACLRQTTTAKEPSYKDYISIVSYLVNNFVNNGYDRNQMSQFSQTPFLISKQRGFPALLTPASLSSDEQAEMLGVQTIHEDLKPHADKFGVIPHPPAVVCARAIIARPPKTPLEANRMFSYMASRIADNDRDIGELLETLSEAQIVPIFAAIGKDGTRKSIDSPLQASRLSGDWQVALISMRPPSTVFIGRNREYKDLLTYVDFGEAANMFLLKAGSKHEPTSVELVRIVSEDPGKFLRSIGAKRYLELLRKFSENQEAIQRDGKLWNKLKKTPFLLALQDRTPKDEKDIDLINLDEDEEDNFEINWSLEKGSDTVVNDDVRQYDLFRQYIKLVPQEDGLEKFYTSLGAAKLTNLVTAKTRQGSALRDQTRAEALSKEIISRSQIFLYEHEKEGSKNIRRNTKWLRSNLKVQEIQHMAIEYTLQGINVTKRETKTAHWSNRDGALKITQNVDMFDIGRELVPVLIQRPKQYEFMAFERIMTEPLRRLQRKGYNVERILRQKEIEATIKESEQQKLFEQEKARREEMKASGNLETSPRNSLERTEKMPGAFGSDSPQRSSENDLDDLRKAGANIFNRFRSGFRSATRGSGPSSPPPSPSGRTIRSPNQQQIFSQSKVLDAVSRTRSHNSSTLNAPPSQQNISVAPSHYCDSSAGHNLIDLPEDAAGASGIRCFASRELPSTDPALLALIRAVRGDFAVYLVTLAQIFDVKLASVHIFYDSIGSTIAFNSGGALFFNCYYFYALHREWKGHRAAVWDYWYLVACHELAHNLVKEHSADHEYLMVEISLRFRERLYGVVFPEMRGETKRVEVSSRMEVD